MNEMNEIVNTNLRYKMVSKLEAIRIESPYFCQIVTFYFDLFSYLSKEIA